MHSPEEIELAKKRQELADLLETQSKRERELASIKAEIRTFERSYEQFLGGRISELEQLEWQISGYLGNQDAREYQKYFHASEGIFNTHIHKTSLLDDDPETSPDLEEKSLKTLYREVAKAIHPDLAPDDFDRIHRQEMMAVANQAYQHADKKTLQKILKDWKLGPQKIDGKDIGNELVRLIRQIAKAKETIQEIYKKIDELRSTDIYHFMHRVEDSLLDGVDMLAEMAATVDLDIARAKKRLAILMGVPEPVEEKHSPQLETRIIRFPAESCGTLYIRNASSADYRDWQRLGIAKGAKEIPLDKGLRLDLRGDSETGFGFIKALQPDDLQALFLYEIGDFHLKKICLLTGLHELYLSNTTVTDQGLSQLGCLKNLRRLYIYHTEITDKGLLNLIQLKDLKWLTLSGTGITEQGLMMFKMAMPNCKVITFKWRYE
jgi:hypothetical protein